jgi:hypothetical protein
VSGGEAAGAGEVTGCDGVKSCVAGQWEGGGEFSGYLSGADDAPRILFTYGW